MRVKPESMFIHLQRTGKRFQTNNITKHNVKYDHTQTKLNIKSAQITQTFSAKSNKH